MQIGKFWVQIKGEPRDFWMGAYIKKPYWEGPLFRQTVYVCLLPMVPIIITWTLRDVLKETLMNDEINAT